jgi:hypothetical protein
MRTVSDYRTQLSPQLIVLFLQRLYSALNQPQLLTLIDFRLTHSPVHSLLSQSPVHSLLSQSPVDFLISRSPIDFLLSRSSVGPAVPLKGLVRPYRLYAVGFV